MIIYGYHRRKKHDSFIEPAHLRGAMRSKKLRADIKAIERHASLSRNRRTAPGFTLVEVMVASLLLLLAMAGIVPFFLGGLNQASSVRYKSIATNIAREKMEQIRQLDYREILDEDDPNPSGLLTLEERFGTTTTQRDITFDIDYDVREETFYETGTLKNATVRVSWTPPPRASPAAISTLIYQERFGPRGERLVVQPTYPDPGGTPFGWIRGSTVIKYYLAEADWGLVFRDVTSPASTMRPIYAKFSFESDAGAKYYLGESTGEDDEPMLPASDYLRYTTDGNGRLTAVWFEYSFDASATPPLVPDGYWTLCATAYNEYAQPGSTWRLRLRIENGGPAAPQNLVAVPQADNETIWLYWSCGPETDRAYWVIERSCWDHDLGDWGNGETVTSDLDANTSSYKDTVSIEEVPSFYKYRVYAVDISSNQGEAAETETEVPPTSTTTTTLPASTTSSTTSTSSSTTTTTLSDYWVQIKNSSNSTYDVEVKDKKGKLVFSDAVGSKEVLTVSGLDAGHYNIVATSRTTQQTCIASFQVPKQRNTTVLELTAD